MSDIMIIGGIVLLFVALGVALPFIQEAFGVEQTANSAEGLINPADASSTVSAFSVIGSVASMFFWTFGALPTWLDLIFVVLRIMLVVTVARNVWIGGGG